MKEKEPRLEYATIRELVIELEFRSKHLDKDNGGYLNQKAGDILSNLDSTSLNFRPIDATDTE